MMTSDLQNDYMDIQQIAAGQELQWEDLPEDSSFRSRYKLADMVNLPCLSKKLTLTGKGSQKVLELVNIYQ